MSSGFRRSLGLYIEPLHIYNVKLLLFSFTLLAIQMGFLSWYTPVLVNEWFYYWAPVVYSLLFWDDALFTLISGPLADAWGRKRLIVIGTSFYPIGTLLLILGMVLKILGLGVMVATMLVALGLVLALGTSAVASPAASALLMESVDADKRATANSMFFLVENIVLSIGSILFAYLLNAFGVLKTFILIFALSTLATISRMFLRETFTETTGGTKLIEFLFIMKRNVISGFRYSPIRALLILSLVIGVGHGIIFFVTPLYLIQNLGFSEIAIGSIYALIPLLRIFLSPISGYVGDRKPYLSLTIGTCISGFLYLVLVVPLENRWIRSMGVVVASALAMFEGVAYSKLLADFSEQSERATFFGLSGFLFSVGMSIGSLLGMCYYWINELPIIISSAILASTIILIKEIQRSQKFTNTRVANQNNSQEG